VDEIALPEGFCDFGKSFWLRASMIGEAAVTLFQLHPGILTTEEKHGKSSVETVCVLYRLVDARVPRS
jgi:hypothetical protein